MITQRRAGTAVGAAAARAAGDGSGRFEAPPVRLGPPDLLFEAPDCFAVGDVDGDGDLDLRPPAPDP